MSGKSRVEQEVGQIMERRAIERERLVDLKAASQLVFLRPKTLSNWLSSGKLKRYKVGGRTLISLSELLALVKQS